jgi:four helix bundle protein
LAQDFQDLTVWHRAMELAQTVYELTKLLPSEELYGLTSHLRRGSVSIASNIAEGRGRGTDGEFKYFLNVAQGSTYEVQTQLLLAKRLKIGNAPSLNRAETLCIETSKMLGAFINSVKS